MPQYIDKDIVKAEIRKRLLPVIRDKHYDEWEEGQDSERRAILSIIDTLDVKEVDLDDKDKWKNTGGCVGTWDHDSPEYYPAEGAERRIKL